MADGQVYFQREWLKDPAFNRSPVYKTLATDPKTYENPSMEGDDQHDFSRFDLSHLKTLAINFVEKLKIPGIGFEKGFLRPLLNGALQTDPGQRISDLSRLPIIGFWSKIPGGHSLQSKLATYALSGEIRYSIFNRDSGPYIIWDHQQQLLQDFEAAAQEPESRKKKNDGSAAFQTMLCYVNAFGTSRDLGKAKQFLHKAEEKGHRLAQVLGPRLLDGFSKESNQPRMEYSQCLALGFSIIGKAQQSSKLAVHNGCSTTTFPDYASFRDVFISEGKMADMDEDDIQRISITTNASSVRQSILEIAVQHGDIELVDTLVSNLNEECDLLTSNIGDVLGNAACHGHGAIVNRILRERSNLTSEEITPLLHWLFCLAYASLGEVQAHLRDRTIKSDLKRALDEPTAYNAIFDPQWPFQAYGTPLATAISSGNVDAVKTLLALRADPLALVYMTSDNSTPKLTPIHLAVHYHLPGILQLLWRAAFGQTKIVADRVYSTPSLENFPIACTLSHLTNAERYAIHGSNYMNNLRKMVQMLPVELLTQVSPEGQNAITQAIDLEDIDTLTLLLERFPALADRKLVQPGNQDLFTYPLHFAAQIGSSRDTDESIQILESIFKLASHAIDQPDSSSAKPMHIAAMGSSPRVMKWLLDKGVSCHQTDGRGQGALHFCRCPENAKILMLSGADFNQRDDLGFTPVHASASQRAEGVLEVLIDAGADLNSNDNGVGTPLHCAVQQKSLPMTEMLLKAKVNIDALDRHGRTPLLVAINTERSDIASLLLDHGADPFIEDQQCSSPFHLALAWENESFLSKILEHSKFRTLSWDVKIKALRFAAKNGERVSLRKYLHQLLGPSLEAISPSIPERNLIQNSIHVAASACRSDLVDAFLSHGFSLESRDSKGNTPLLTACQAGRDKPGKINAYFRTRACDKLITVGANILATNDDGQTPLRISQTHADFPLMTHLLDYALEPQGWSLSLDRRRKRLLDSIKDPEKDDEFCAEALALLGGETINLELLPSAALKNEWDFVMSFIGGHFTTKADLCSCLGLDTEHDTENELHGQNLPPDTTCHPDSKRSAKKRKASDSPDSSQSGATPKTESDSAQPKEIQPNTKRKSVDLLDLLRFYSITKDRDMVRYLYGLLKDEKVTHQNTRGYDFGRPNFQFEVAETKALLSEMIWGKQIGFPEMNGKKDESPEKEDEYGESDGAKTDENDEEWEVVSELTSESESSEDFGPDNPVL